MYLPRHRIQKHILCVNWENGVQHVCSLLENDNLVTSEYSQAVINAIYKHGPYCVIAPKIMLAHARPQEGGLKNGLSFVSLYSEIVCQHIPIKYIFALSTTDNDKHIELIQSFADILDRDDIYTILEHHPESLENLFKKN